MRAAESTLHANAARGTISRRFGLRAQAGMVADTENLPLDTEKFRPQLGCALAARRTKKASLALAARARRET